MPDAQPEQVRYEIVRKIARGGMGEVFLARQIGFGGFAKDVVLKRIHEDLADDPDFVEQFLQEARIAAMLDHPNIVQILGLGQQDRDHFIVMEYVHGLSLSRLIKRMGGPLPVPIAVQIAIHVAAGLEFAHTASDPTTGDPLKLVHRDISPPNILVSTSGSVKITDFGIAKVRWSANKTRAGVVKGKYSYLSPEQVRGKKATRQSDIYSLGLNLYEMTTGQRAYPAGEHAEVLRAVAKGKIARPDEHVPDFPPDLEEVLMKALAMNPKQRYTACAHLQEDLQDLLHAWEITIPPARVGRFVREVLRGDPVTDPAAVESATEPGMDTPPLPMPLDEEETGEFEDQVERDGEPDTQVVRMTTVHLTPPVVQIPHDLPDPDKLQLPRMAEHSLPPQTKAMSDARRAAPVVQASPDLASLVDLTDEVVDPLPPPRRKLPLLLLAAGIGSVLLVAGLIVALSGPPETPEDPTGRAVTTNLVQTTAPGAPPETVETPPPRVDAAPLERDLPVLTRETSPDAAADAPAPDPPDRGGTPAAPARRVIKKRAKNYPVELTISTEPGTLVSMGKRRLGITPLKIRIPKAKAVLLFRNHKHKLHATRVITPHSDRITARFVFRQGKIGIRSPGPTLVAMDGRKLGVTPMAPIPAYEGKHKLQFLIKATGRKVRKTVQVTPGNTVWVELK